MVEETSSSEVKETLAPNGEEKQTTNEATIESAQGGTESTCNNGDKENHSDGEREKSLDFAEELMEKGSKAMKDGDFSEATDCFSRALEIRVARYGELSPECVNAYYKYGCALLYKAQEEADPLGNVPKKEGESQNDSTKDRPVKSAGIAESSTASASSNVGNDSNLNKKDGPADDVSSGKGQDDEDDEGSDAEDQDLAEADEDESDLDLAWKMLDVARAIAEKNSGDTMEKVDILSTLAEVAMEREDIETSLSDYHKALDILMRLVEPDSRHIAELNFRICLCLELGGKPEEAILYCQKAISVCKERVQRLKNETISFSGSTVSSSVLELDLELQSTSATQPDNFITDKQAEIETLTGLMGELEKKLEDLQQLASNPKSILSELMGIVAAKAKGPQKDASMQSSSQMGTATSNGVVDSPTVSTAHSNGPSGVTHLGVVGRGIKRMAINSSAAESSPLKKPAPDSSENRNSNAS